MTQPYMVLPVEGSDQADEWVRLGVEAQMAGRLGEAQQKYHQALRLDPRHAVATINLAVLLAQSNFLNEALITAERASLLDGTHFNIAVNRALLAMEAGRMDEALSQARRAVSAAPAGPAGNPARMVLAMVVSSCGRPEESVPLYNAVLDCEPGHPVAAPNCCFAQTLTDATPADMLRQRRRWRDAQGYRGKVARHDPLPITIDGGAISRPLRVGYVGGDFKQHSASFIFSRVLLHHSPAVEMYLYSSLPVDPATDPRTQKFMDRANHDWAPGTGPNKGSRWRDISAMTDEDADKLIRKDRIDVLVDLAAHTGGGRLALFTRKPTPVQVTAWGFAHGTGLPEIDYFFADPVAVRPEEREHFAEKVWDLPCIVTYEPPEEYQLKGVSLPPVRNNGYVTFGSYARYEKMSDAYLRACAAVLRRVPDSKLEFKDHGFRRPDSIRRVLEVMNAGAGDANSPVGMDRLLFSLQTDNRDHLLAYQQADLILNPFPHSGGCVSLEQLWMGVPLLTLDGPNPGSRSAASVLTVLGRTGWIAQSPEEYVEKAAGLAENGLKELADARKTLRQELVDSPVIKGYVGAVESAYVAMVKEKYGA